MIFAAESSVTKRGGFTMRTRIASTLAPAFDAEAGVDHISDVLLAGHLEAIEGGRRADGSGAQRQLLADGHQGERAADGERPPIRGFTGGSERPFAESIIRTQIKSRLLKAGKGKPVRTRARARVQPNAIHVGWLTVEADQRGVQYFFIGGAMNRAVQKALRQWTGLALKGSLKSDPSQRLAKDAKNR